MILVSLSQNDQSYGQSHDDIVIQLLHALPWITGYKLSGACHTVSSSFE